MTPNSLKIIHNREKRKEATAQEKKNTSSSIVFLCCKLKTVFKQQKPTRNILPHAYSEGPGFQKSR